MTSQTARALMRLAVSAVVLACAQAPCAAGNPSTEWQVLMYAPTQVPGLMEDGFQRRGTGSLPEMIPESCTADEFSGTPDVHSPDPTLLDKFACWWNLGLEMQSRALVP